MKAKELIELCEEEAMTPATMKQAKDRWGYTKSVLANDARSSFKAGTNWMLMGQYPTVVSSDKNYIIHFYNDKGGNTVGMQGIPPGISRKQANCILQGGVCEQEDGGEEDEPQDITPLTSKDVKVKIVPTIVKIAQEEYDAWDESVRDVYAGGGICHLIAERIVNELIDKGINAATVSGGGEQHVYTVAQLSDGVFVVDIPPFVYEKGGGFSWTKLPDVKFESGDVSVSRIDSDPKEFSKYIEEF